MHTMPLARAALFTLAATLTVPASGVAGQSSASATRASAAAGSAAEGPVRAAHGMVVSENWHASEVGRDVLAAGGNAVDAAIATGFALAVTHPSAGNIGGGGFMVIRFPNGNSTTIDFREKAPLAATPDMWLDENGDYSAQIQHHSLKSVGVPGTVAGFDKVHRLYGSLNWERIVYPAVGLAQDGFELSERQADSFASLIKRMNEFPSTVAKFSKQGTPYAAGETWKQPDLAKTLRRIMLNGADGFYRGETAKLIADEMRRGGGLITEADLGLYQAKERTPIRGLYRGYEVIGMPPPSSGGVAIVEMLNMLEPYDLKAMGFNSASYIHTLTEVMRRAFRDRAISLGDEDFVDVPVHMLTSKMHAQHMAADIDPDHASKSSPADVVQRHESMETTHYSVVDADGMAVSVTYTLEQGYGVGDVVPGGGFLLNNEMGDFNAGPGITTDRGLIGTSPNLARPEQRMLSSMSPSILAKDGKLVAVIGSPGGRTIINTVLEVMLDVIDFDMNIQDAVDAPRLHHQWLPDVTSIEEGGAGDDVVAKLRSMGHEVQVGGQQGVANCIMIDPATGDRLGAADKRNPDGGARGS